MKDKTLRTAELFGCLNNLTFGATRTCRIAECMSMIPSVKSALIIRESCDGGTPTTDPRGLPKTSAKSRISTGDRRIVLNVSGRRFETWKSTLGKHPETLLGSKTLEKFYDAERKEYFIDRDPYLFKFVLNYYQNGNLHCSTEDCPEAFEEELNFYGLSIYDVDDCCWEVCSPKEKNILVEDHEEGEILNCEGDARGDLHCEPKRSLRQKIWRTIGPSKTTKAGIYFHIIYGFFIFVSVLVTTLETVQCEEGKTCGDTHEIVFFVIDSVCVAIFTFELVLRFLVCPRKGKFFRDIMNVIDVLAVLPYYVTLILEQFGVQPEFLAALKVIRVMRILKLTRNSRRLRCLLLTLRRCSVDILFLYCLCFLAIILYGTVIYYLEFIEGGRQFSSIPESFWYICVTLMTVGYGDVVPATVLGKLIGSVCCVSGVVILALPIPILQEKQVPCTLESVTSRRRHKNTHHCNSTSEECCKLIKHDEEAG